MGNRLGLRVAPMLATWASVGIVLLCVLAASGGLDPTGGAVGSGGREAMAALVAIAVVPAFIVRLRLQAPTWIAWLAGGLSAGLATAMWLLVVTGRDALAWSVYGGLHVLRGAEPFWDLGAVLRWLDCDGCAELDPNYGSSVLWLKPASFGLLSASRQSALGLALVVVMSGVLVWLGRASDAAGHIALLASSIGGAWLLLLDRGNLDAIAIAVPVAGVLLLRRWDRLWAWWVLAAALWVLGTWKYYPFALGLMLLPALRVRRGWTVIVGYGIASSAFMAASWEAFRRSSDTYATFTVVDDFPALGRIPIIVRMVGGLSPVGSSVAASALVLVVVLAAAWWGWSVSRRVQASRGDAMLALAGTSAFLASCFAGGFGFAYKACFLLLAVPLLSRAASSPSRLALYAGVVGCALVVVTQVVNYQILTTSVASMVAAGLALGMGAAVGLRRVVADPRPSPMPRTASP